MTAPAPFRTTFAVVFAPPVFTMSALEVKLPVPVTLRLPTALPVAAELEAMEKLPPEATVKEPPLRLMVPVAVPLPPVPDFVPRVTVVAVNEPVSNSI